MAINLLHWLALKLKNGMLWHYINSQTMHETAGSHPAVVFGDHTLTYSELILRATRLALEMEKIGVETGHIVLAFFDNTPSFLVALLACTKLRCAFSPMDINLKEKEIQSILTLTTSNLILTDNHHLEQLKQFKCNFLCLTDQGDIETINCLYELKPCVSDNIGCIPFSSGTTGIPKGILISHEAFYHRANDIKEGLQLTNKDRTLCALPMSHPHGAECLALPTLLAGGTLFLKEPKFAYPLYILEELAQLKITFFSSVPTFYDFAVKVSGHRSVDLSALRHTICGSAALTEATAKTFFEKYHVHIKQGYGLAELTAICLNHHDSETISYRCVGQPLKGIEWRLKKDDTENAGAENNNTQSNRMKGTLLECKLVEGALVEGELLVKSHSLFSGYLNDVIGTQAVYQDGWFHTSDIVSVDALGRFQIIGRKESFAKINGFKVTFSEIEHEIMTLPWIKECIIISEKDAQDTEQLTAYVAPIYWEKTIDAMQNELKTHLRKHLSDYKIPTKWHFKENLPKTSLGKVQKRKLEKDSI